jgi:hypothetical protein
MDRHEGLGSRVWRQVTAPLSPWLIGAMSAGAVGVALLAAYAGWAAAGVAAIAAVVYVGEFCLLRMWQTWRSG